MILMMVTQNMLRTYEWKYVLSDLFTSDLWLILINTLAERLKTRLDRIIKKTRSLHTCAPLSELPSNINTMAEVGTSINWLDWYYDKQYLYSLARVQYMVLILDGNSEHVAHAWRKIGSFEKKKKKICHRSYQMPWLVQLTKISPYVRTHFSKLP